MVPQLQIPVTKEGTMPVSKKKGTTSLPNASTPPSSSLAVPDRHMVENIQNAVRLILTLELLQSQSKERQLTPQQEAELAERKRRAEGELKGGFSQLYPVVSTPQASEQSGRPYVLDELQVQSYSQDPQIQKRLKEALHNRVVWDSVQPSKMAALTRLNELEPLDRQYYLVPALVACFFRYYNWTHIWDEQVIRQAIAVGIKNRTFGYVANARRDAQENLVLNGPAATVVHFGEDVPNHELDMGEGAFLLSAAYAQQLLAPPAPPKVEPPPVTQIPGDSQQEQQPSQVYIPVGETGKTIINDSPSPSPVLPASSPAKPVAPGHSGQRYRLRIQAKPGDFFEVTKALERLADRSAAMHTTITVLATARADQPFNANTMHNLVVEPMVEESNATVLEEQVEE